MEMSKIILTVKENMVGLKQVGVNEFKSYTSKSESSKVAALEAFMTLMKSVETNATISESVIHIFLPDVIYKPFVNGTIASYIRCGKTRNGSELSLDELKAYDLAYDMYLERAKNLVLRTSDFKALDKIKETSVKAEIKECYLKLEKALKKAQSQPQVIVQAPVAPVMSESTKRMLDMLHTKAEEALLAGDIDLMERLLAQATKMEASFVSQATQAVAPTTTESTNAVETNTNTANTTVEAPEASAGTTVETSVETNTTGPANDLGFTIKVQKGNDDIPEGLAAFMNAK